MRIAPLPSQTDISHIRPRWGIVPLITVALSGVAQRPSAQARSVEQIAPSTRKTRARHRICRALFREITRARGDGAIVPGLFTAVVIERTSPSTFGAALFEIKAKLISA